MPKHGKRYRDLVKDFDTQKEYPLAEAVTFVKKFATAKFDETVELHYRLGIDPRQADQQIRTTLMLPHGLGKSVTILVFAEGEDAKAAEDAGADIIANDEIIARIQKEGWAEFDAAIAVPSMMPKVGRLGRVLGPRGLMPTPKAGTVVQPADLPRAVNELKSGRIEFRNDRTGNLHIPVGKASFDYQKLLENVQAAVDAVQAQSPSGIKGIFIRRVVLASTMGPGVKVSL
ncbi:MAG: 50S ribosomal protein L1 [Anaerolineae bacterium]|nr:50S ribosomal protein L1 [Anaerolineae bacterium]MDQ7033979.1 50S ribosomal protein L1 [Anaerolineae bacterium]